MRKIAAKAPKEVKVISELEHQEDYYKGFRSAVVLVWMFCNFALAAVVLSTAGLDRISVKNAETQRSGIYLAVVLWSVAGLSLFRFIGAVWFLVVRMVSLYYPCAPVLCEMLLLHPHTITSWDADMVTHSSSAAYDLQGNLLLSGLGSSLQSLVYPVTFSRRIRS